MAGTRWPLNTERAGPIWTWFDAAWYGRSDAAAAAAAALGPADALADHQERGAALGFPPNMLFDPGFYLASDENAAASVAAGEFASAFEHYRAVGWRTMNPHWLFKLSRYDSINKGLTAVAEDFGGLYGHFLAFGAAEGRTAHPLFDTAHYLGTLSPDDADAARADPFSHFLGALDASVASDTEPSGSVFFDPDWYRANYPDADRAMRQRGWSALQHYLCLGTAAGLDPLCDFSEADYLSDNPALADSVRRGVFRNGYDHYLEFGAFGLRSPMRGIDMRWYAAQPRVTEDLETGLFVHPFAHLLQVGIPRGLPLAPPVDRHFTLDEGVARTAFLAQAERALPELGRHGLRFGHAGTPAVSVIMVLHNQFALTMQTLASLRSTFAGPVQLILVDNGSTDNTAAIDDLVDGALLLRQTENIGFLLACNLALPHATAPATLFLNNDLVLHPGAVERALARLLSDPSIGAVGGKIVRTHGLLQEAGSIVWRDGSTSGYLRDQPPDTGSANFVRDVDYCSGAFLLLRTEVVQRLGGFDPAFAPAYYEEVDLCLRLQAEGLRVVYDPGVSMTHYEYGSSRSARAAMALMARNRAALRARHAVALRTREADPRRTAAAASRNTDGRRLLMFEDTVPLLRLGSGYPRAADAVLAFVALGWQVTVFPMQKVLTPLHQITAGLPDTVEVMWDSDHSTLDRFLEDRRGCFDVVWVSRAHNLHLLQTVLRRSGVGLGDAKLVLDTEAVFSCRHAEKAALDGLPFNLRNSLVEEFEGAWQCDTVVAVTANEAEVLRTLPFASVSPVGIAGWHDAEGGPAPPMTAAPFAERAGLLHVGALMAADTPNSDGLRWFLDEVQPLLIRHVGTEAATLTVAGHVGPLFDPAWLTENPHVRFLGPVSDLGPLFARARCFIAPTRFAAGVPTKVLDAALHGVPVACTSLLARQLGWTDGEQLLCAGPKDAAGFAANVGRLLLKPAKWAAQRRSAYQALLEGYSFARFRDQVAQALKDAGAPQPEPKRTTSP